MSQNAPMPVNVTIHESQFPEVVQEQLKECLRTRQINHKFHYQTYRQTEKWHALHRAYAPSGKGHRQPDVYEAAFQGTGRVFRPDQLVGLCCGYAEKEARLLQHYQMRGDHLELLKPIGSFVACDASVPIVLRAAQAAAAVIGMANCRRLVCDLQEANDLSDALTLGMKGKAVKRLFTFFGSIHNFEPNLIFPRLAVLLNGEDLLLFSANLIRETAPIKAIKEIVPQYANTMTFDWLFQLLSDLGFSRKDGTMKAKVEPCPIDPDLLRISIYHLFDRHCSITLEGEQFSLKKRQFLRLFYSYRYTLHQVSDWLSRSHLKCLQPWISQHGEEGVFLVKKF